MMKDSIGKGWRVGNHLLQVLVTILLASSIWPAGPSGKMTIVSASTAEAQSGISPASGPTISGLATNLADYRDGRVPRYAKFEISFDVTGTTAANPYFPYDTSTPPGVESATGITVDALFLPPGEVNWSQAETLPCFYYQPVEQVGSGMQAALLPAGEADWRCRFAPGTVGTWRYKVRATDAGGTSESTERQFTCALSDRKGFVKVSQTDPRFFEFSDGTPFVTPLVNIEEGSPFNTLAGIRANIQKMGENGVRFVRWFPTGEGANYFVAPFADTMRINWGFGDSWVTSDDPDTGSGKLFSYAPYYYSSQSIPAMPSSRYRLSFRAKVTGERVLRPEVGGLSGGTMDICSGSSTYHESNGESCTHKQDGWHDYVLEVETTASAPPVLYISLHGLYVSSDAPAPYNSQQEGSIRIHSIQLQRDEAGDGSWGPNLLTRSDPDTYKYVDQRAAAKLDEIFRLSEQYGVYHKLTLFHKNDQILNLIQPDGTVGPWGQCGWGQCPKNFYSDENQASRWYQRAYTRYFIARWAYSPALHSLELANENPVNDGTDGNVFDAAFSLAEYVRNVSPRHILMSNSFWGWWLAGFWTDPTRGYLMDYSDKHWYANQEGSSCDDSGENCELISNVWADSAAYVRECWDRFEEYSQTFDYDKPIVRGEGGVAQSGTQPQHPDIAAETQGIYYHKKLWAHVGVLGYSCDGEWYPRLFVPYDDQSFPNSQRDLYQMFAAYERFMAGEPVSNGRYAPIGTDRNGTEQIALTHLAGELRAWGVQDATSGRALLWVDNARHTWKNVVDGVAISSASAVLTIPGFGGSQVYTVQWWNPYASDPAEEILKAETLVSQSDGSLAIAVNDLAKDVAVKIGLSRPWKSYLPLVLDDR